MSQNTQPTGDDWGGQSSNPTSEPTVHTNIGDREGIIVECRPTDVDRPRERDMSHLTDDAAEDLRDQLDAYLEGKQPDNDPVTGGGHQ
jgi:hypothetical protein